MIEDRIGRGEQNVLLVRFTWILSVDIGVLKLSKKLKCHHKNI